MNCIACGDTGLSSRGYPCICAKVGNKYVLMPMRRTETRAESLVREMTEMLRLLKAPEVPPPTDEDIAEQERRSKVLALKRELEGLL